MFLCTTRTCFFRQGVHISFLSHFHAWEIFLEFGFGGTSHTQHRFSLIAFVGVKSSGERSSWLVHRSVLLTSSHSGHFTAWKGNIRGFFHLHSVLRSWALEIAIARWDLALGVALHSRSVCLVFFVSLLSWKRDLIDLVQSFLPSLDFDSMGAGYHHMSVVRTTLTHPDSGSSYCVLIDDALGRMDGFYTFVFFFIFAFEGYLSYRSISVLPG